MHNATDKFFQEMLDSAKRQAKKEVKQETRDKLAVVGHTKRQLAAAKKEIKVLRKPENEIAKRDKAVTKREQRCSSREADIRSAEKEIGVIMDQIDNIRNETIVTTTTTARTFAKGSKVRGYYGRMYESTKALALASIRRRAKKESKS